MGYDKKLGANVINTFVTVVNRFYRYQAKQTLGSNSISIAHPGSVSMIQCFDSALRLNGYAQTLALDGVYVHDTENFYCEVAISEFAFNLIHNKRFNGRGWQSTRMASLLSLLVPRCAPVVPVFSPIFLG